MSGFELDPDPLAQFRAWFAEAAQAEPARPEAMALATATPAGAPSLRMVLLKGVDERGFAFFTNLESRKGVELAANPRAALLFHWRTLGRQLRVEGSVVRVPDEEATGYFASRPVGSRIAAIASPQSRPLVDRAELERLVEETRDRYPGHDVPLPAHWGGFRLVPEAYEFWRHGDDRLHDRLRYERDVTGWSRTRLAP
jgi:pyridoxamine 5'-phosphate oxidase